MNHMEKVAEMLGVKMGEQFKIMGRGSKYDLAPAGLYSSPGNNWCPIDLVKLISGELQIDRPWKPRNEERYFHIGNLVDVKITEWRGSLYDALNYKTGNCFKTEEEAEKYKPQIIAMLESKEVLFNVK